MCYLLLALSVSALVEKCKLKMKICDKHIVILLAILFYMSLNLCQFLKANTFNCTINCVKEDDNEGREWGGAVFQKRIFALLGVIWVRVWWSLGASEHLR